MPCIHRIPMSAFDLFISWLLCTSRAHQEIKYKLFPLSYLPGLGYGPLACVPVKCRLKGAAAGARTALTRCCRNPRSRGGEQGERHRVRNDFLSLTDTIVATDQNLHSRRQRRCRCREREREGEGRRTLTGVVRTGKDIGSFWISTPYLGSSKANSHFVDKRNVIYLAPYEVSPCPFCQPVIFSRSLRASGFSIMVCYVLSES
jgi:hypothetical protein